MYFLEHIKNDLRNHKTNEDISDLLLDWMQKFECLFFQSSKSSLSEELWVPKAIWRHLNVIHYAQIQFRVVKKWGLQEFFFLLANSKIY